MKNMLLIGAGMVILSVGSVRAEGDAAAPAAVPADAAKQVEKAPAAPRLVLEDLVVTGVITEQKSKKDKVFLVLVGDDGSKTRLPPSTPKDATDLKTLVGAKVKITGKGMIKEHGGKKISAIKVVSSVEKLDAPAAK